MLNNIRIVLLHTSHPGNIGSSARAMKTMGLSRLYLVKPKILPDGKARALATSAVELLDQAVICDSLAEAVADCQLVFGSGSELRVLESPVVTPRQAALQIVESYADQQVAFVFGRESSGMTNEEMQLCQQQIQIPGNPEYCSLNLAAAVQVMTYELRMAYLAAKHKSVQNTMPTLATNQQMEGLFEHFQQTMQQVGFYDPVKPYSLMTKLRRIFNAAGLKKQEVDLLRGFLRAVNKSR